MFLWNLFSFIGAALLLIVCLDILNDHGFHLRFLEPVYPYLIIVAFVLALVFSLFSLKKR